MCYKADIYLYMYEVGVCCLLISFSGVITSGDIADSPVMKKMDDNRGLMNIRDASHKHIQPLTLAYFRRDLIKLWRNVHLISTFMRVLF